MQVGLIGVGRMGKELARRLAGHIDLTVYDRDSALLTAVCSQLPVKPAGSIEELATLGTVILAVPDPEVINCIKDFNQLKVPLVVVNVATNVSRQVLEEAAGKQVKCIGVKFIGHAGEMALGHDPVIIADDRPLELLPLVKEIFREVGVVIIGKADMVTYINSVAAAKALEAAVNIEEGLKSQGVTNPDMIRSAIGQVAAGVLKAYAEQDLGPFAREIVRAVRVKMRK